jgi:hypothetical protein
MGMTILQAKQRLHEKWMQLTKDGTDEEMMQALSIADTVLGNYNETLKDDLVAMLTELQLEIEELDNPLDYDFEGYNQCAVDCEKIIQEKMSSIVLTKKLQKLWETVWR